MFVFGGMLDKHLGLAVKNRIKNQKLQTHI